MASTAAEADQISDEILKMVRRHFDGRKRNIETTIEENLDGEKITQIHVFLDPDETNEITALGNMRHDYALLTRTRSELANAQLSFRVNMSAALKGHETLGTDAELTKIHKMIENLSP